MAPDRQSMAERLGNLTLETTDYLRATYGDDVSVGAAAIVVDVIAGNDEGHINPTLVFSNEPRHWVRVALLEEALDEAEARNARRLEELDYEGLEED